MAGGWASELANSYGGDWDRPESDSDDGDDAEVELELTVLERRAQDKQSQPVVNPFDRFKRIREGQAGPALAVHERDRKVPKKPPSGKKTGGGGHRASKEPTSITPQQRLREFPDYCLRISAGKLFCPCCKETLSLIKTSVSSHVKSAKHRTKQDAFACKREDDSELAQVHIIRLFSRARG